MNSFRIDTVARNNNIVLLQGLKSNNIRFSVLISRHINIINQAVSNYIFSNGSYYIISIINNDNVNNELNNLNNNNFLWEHPNYNEEFPYYMYGLTDGVYYYTKGLILTF